MIRRPKVKDAETVLAVLLAAREEIPLTRNFADDAYKKWVRVKCRDRRVWIFEREAEAAGVVVMSVREIFYLTTSPRIESAGSRRPWSKTRRHACGRGIGRRREAR